MLKALSHFMVKSYDTSDLTEVKSLNNKLLNSLKLP